MTSCFSQPNLLPFEQAQQIIADNLELRLSSENIAIEKALGRVLAENVISPVNVPPHNNSAMDGYAFNAESLKENKTLTLVGRAMAGTPFQGKVEIGQCVRIMTGAKLPEGCDSVEMQENTEVKESQSNATDGTQVSFLQAVRAGQHVRYAGEDIRLDDCILANGKTLTSVDIGTLASVGVAKVAVVKPLTVALIATGDELKQPGEALTEGDIYESNRYFLSSMLEKLNVKVIDFGVIPDDKALITQAFSDANRQADVVISSGGVSVGDADYTKQVLNEQGDIGFWKIAMKPGKPFAFGKFSQSYFFGLPGNPVSALVTFYQLVVPALYQLMEAEVPKRIQLQAKTTTDLKKAPGRMDFQRAVWSMSDSGDLKVTSTGAQGSGILTSIAKANCFILLPQEQGRVSAGESVTIELFDSLLLPK